MSNWIWNYNGAPAKLCSNARAVIQKDDMVASSLVRGSSIEAVPFSLQNDVGETFSHTLSKLLE